MLLFLMNFDRLTPLHLHAALEQHADASPSSSVFRADSFLSRNKETYHSKKNQFLCSTIKKLRFKFTFKKYLDDLQVQFLLFY